jgi:serine/threonine protein phosphatase 1
MENSKKIAVIGDIHGCIGPLKDIYEKIVKYTNEVYSVGDLIDRGKNSKEVIQFCIDNKISPVKGNHEDMMLKAIQSF